MVYFPIVGRLNCNSDSQEHRGFWQIDGFGLMAMYKSDWTKLGGMVICETKNCSLSYLVCFNDLEETRRES